MELLKKSFYFIFENYMYFSSVEGNYKSFMLFISSFKNLMIFSLAKLMIDFLFGKSLGKIHFKTEVAKNSYCIINDTI